MTYKENNISVRLMGVPERMEHIKKLVTQLNIPEEMVFIDPEHKGVIYNAKRAWLAETDKPFTLVIQDDCVVCDNFLYYCNKAIRAYPKAIFSLFPFQFTSYQQLMRRGYLPTVSPYVTTNLVCGCAILMPTEYVKPCIESWPADAKGDDISIQYWAEKTNKCVLTTIPVMVQHIGQESVFDKSRSLGGTDLFRKDVSGANWNNRFITPWTNLL